MLETLFIETVFLDAQINHHSNKKSHIHLDKTPHNRFFSPIEKVETHSDLASHSITTCPTDVLSKLKNINDDFLTEHQATSPSSLKDVDSVMVYRDAKLSLWKKVNNSFQEIECVASAASEVHYTLLKQVSHIPVLIVTLLEKAINDPGSKEKVIIKMQQLLKNLADIQPSIHQVCSDDDLDNQKKIITESEEILRLLIAKQCDGVSEGLKKYMKSIAQELNDNGKRATQIQLNSLHNIVMKWEKQHSIDLDANRVLIVGVHGPRKGLIESQYFEKLYASNSHVSIEDDKLFYVEMLPSQMGNIDTKKDLIEGFLANCEINKAIGQNMFEDKGIMFADILHPSAPEVLDGLYEGVKCPVMHG